MHYQWFEKDINDAWITNLITAFGKIRSHVHTQTGHYLKTPNFIINPNLNYRWGEWNPKDRTITISLNLLRQFEWAAVEHVLKHEVAHQLVDEIFNLPASPHGEAWIRACTILDIEPNVTNSAFQLSQFKGGTVSPVIDKIRKLIIHGNDNGISKEESETFLTKAQELLLKYNLSMANIHGMDTCNNTFYTIRPVGPNVSAHKSYLGSIASLVSTFYNVSHIWTYTQNNLKRLELFGTTANLDIAEYVFHALLTQAEHLWEDYKLDHEARLKFDPQYRQQVGNTAYGNKHRISKPAFMQGLVNGYTAKLRKEKNVVLDSITPDDKAIILANDKLLKDSFENHYHPRNLARTSSRGMGYSEGHKAGSNLSLSIGIQKGQSNSRLMIA